MRDYGGQHKGGVLIMGKWVAEVTLEPIEFDGDKITFTAKRLLAEDMGVVLQNYDSEKETLRFASHGDLAKVAADIFPKYVTAIDGMTKGDGTPFTVPEFIAASKEFYFMPLVTGLFTRIMGISSVGKEAKNSEPPAPVSLEASGGQS